MDAPIVTLRGRTDDDLDLLYRLAADLDTWEERNPSSPAPLTREAFDARRTRSEQDAAPGEARFVIEADGVAVGSVALFHVDPLAHHGEVGIGLLREARGRGIGTSALAELVRFGFERANLRRIHLQVIASNRGAIRSYEKVGFVVEGRLREHAWVRGDYEDLVLMGVLRSDRAASAAR